MANSILKRTINIRYARNRQKGESIISLLLVIFICLCLGDIISFYSDSIPMYRNVQATSINYGISQQPITEINQLMPKLCQNQSVICEGSYCIPGVRKCVCDLRMPVQFGRFCLRQVDIETKCFVSNQCNHTIKAAVCIDINSNSILDADSSKFKLDQWQQLNELRQMSQSTLNKEAKLTSPPTLQPERSPKPMFLFENNNFDRFSFEARDDVIISNARNSPYEINYNTPELLQQNHTRRKINPNDKLMTNMLSQTAIPNFKVNKDTQVGEERDLSSRTQSDSTTPSITTSQPVMSTTIVSVSSTTEVQLTTRSVKSNQNSPTEAGLETFNQDSRPTTSAPLYNENSQNGKKKMIIKSASWPPGICSCPFGFMFDSMLRKCLALSLIDSHCQVDLDCKQIASTHCSSETKKCECDEPLVWDHKELACLRPKPVPTTESPSLRKDTGGIVENLLPPLVLAKLLPDYTLLLLIFVVIIILATLIILRLTVKCFSSNSSALISPKSKKKKTPTTNNVPPISPYATLRRPHHKPSSQLSNFTQATRGRILNYDFEQEGPNPEQSSSPQPPAGTLQRTIIKEGRTAADRASTLRPSGKTQKSQALPETTLPRSHKTKVVDEPDDQLLELNDNISISQMESESKSDNSILAIPAPPPTQQPPYMLASAMKGQGSAIAAAAAAVANKRMQMAQKKSLDQQQQNSGRANGSPVFL